jgi:hypothetical protein
LKERILDIRGCIVAGVERSDRMPLDALVTRLRDPTFAARHRREVSLRSTSAHVNPVMLAVCSVDSLYVREWRRHAQKCAACARLFAYFNLDVKSG